MAGMSVEIGLGEIEPANLFPGAVLCSEGWPCTVAQSFECQLVVLEPPVPILPGLHVSLHAHAVRESGQISKLVSIINNKTGDVIKSKPRCLIRGQTAIVEIDASRSICIEAYSRMRSLGRITVRESGRTIAVGIVTKTL